MNLRYSHILRDTNLLDDDDPMSNDVDSALNSAVSSDTKPAGNTLSSVISCLSDYDPDALPVADAQAIIRQLIQPINAVEKIALRSALDRVLAADIVSPINVPSHDNSAMDGYALYGNDLSKDQDLKLKVIGTAYAGRAYDGAVNSGECVRIMTGAVMPAQCDTVALANGKAVGALRLGRQVIARVPQDAGMFDSVTYLLGAAVKADTLAASDVRLAFTGSVLAPRLGDVAGPDTVLCPAQVDASAMCASLAAIERRAAGRVDRALEPAALDAFLHSHPHAMLVDVREECEHLASDSPAWGARKVHNVPMSMLAGRVAAWLHGEPRTLVFFCRSGGRSARAAQCLHRSGYDDAWHVSGALAFSGEEGETAVA